MLIIVFLPLFIYICELFAYCKITVISSIQLSMENKNPVAHVCNLKFKKVGIFDFKYLSGL